MYKFKFISIALLFALSISIAGCTGNKDNQKSEEEEIVPVIVQKVEKKSVENTERYIGIAGQIVSQDNILVKLNLSETELDQFSLNQQVRVRIPSIDKEVKGVVSYVSAAANVQTLTFPVEIKVVNPNDLIKPGMLVEVTMKKRIDNNQIGIPTEAVLGTSNNTYVYVVNKNKAMKRDVKVQEMTSDHTIIKSGLKEGELIILKGQYEVSNGSKVEIIKQESREEGENHEAS